MENNGVTEEVKNEEKVDLKLNEKQDIPEAKAKKGFKMSKKLIGIIAGVVVLIIVGSVIAMFMSNNSNLNSKAKQIYDVMNDTSDLLDDVADEVYSCWYGYVYEKEYKSVDAALLDAYVNEADTINKIKANDVLIEDLLKQLKDKNYKNKNENAYNSMLDAYDSYKEYYEFVINVSGSFNSYSAKKEELKKEVKSYLNKFNRNL